MDPNASGTARIRGTDIRIDRIGTGPRTLLLLHADALDDELVRDTLSVLLKRETDLAEVQKRIEPLVRAVLADTAGPL